MGCGGVSSCPGQRRRWMGLMAAIVSGPAASRGSSTGRMRAGQMAARTAHARWDFTHTHTSSQRGLIECVCMRLRSNKKQGGALKWGADLIFPRLQVSECALISPLCCLFIWAGFVILLCGKCVKLEACKCGLQCVRCAECWGPIIGTLLLSLFWCIKGDLIQ